MSVKKVIVAVSGGVDSAVSALLLKKKGFDVHGVFMKNWDVADEGVNCSAANDAEDAEFVCKKLGIPFMEVSFVKEFWNEVFSYMLDSYQKGFIPNPDIVCNKEIKFGMFFKYATEQLGADALATGHYARTSFGCFLEKYKPSEHVSLLKAVDGVKDQTFFLSQVSQKALRRTMFPLGEMKKSEVKQIARQNGLERIAKKDESMGMCFIGRRSFKQFIDNYVKPKPGKFIDISTGKVVGTHEGIHQWVQGQRIRIGGMAKPGFVLRKCQNNDIVVGFEVNHPDLFSYIFTTGEPHWINKAPNLDLYFDCEFLFQHIKPTVKCRIVPLRSGGMSVVLQNPLTQINSGQFAVFYEGEQCLGSAEITAVGPTYFSLGKRVPNNFREYYDEIENTFF